MQLVKNDRKLITSIFTCSEVLNLTVTIYPTQAYIVSATIQTDATSGVVTTLKEEIVLLQLYS